MGGGLGVTYHDEKPPQPSEYAKALLDRLSNHQDIELVFEPGRAIAANAGVLLTKVEFLKHTEHKNFAIIDAAMNDLLRPALYQAWQEIVPVIPRDGEAQTYDLVGPVCETGDYLGKDRAWCWKLAICWRCALPAHTVLRCLPITTPVAVRPK